VLLPEIGEAGQRAILAGTAAVGGPSAAHAVAERYARAAGFDRVALGEVDAAAEPDFVIEPAARAVLAGSRASLRQIALAARGGRPA